MIHQLVAAALLLVQAAPAERPCITHEEAGDMAVSLLPFMLDAAAVRCRPHLTEGAFLLTGAADWSARLRRDSVPRRASALRGIGKMGGATAPEGAGGEAAFDFLAQLVTGGLTQSLQPETCPQIDTIAQSLAPLPTDNSAQLVGAVLTLALAATRTEGEAGDNEASQAGPEAAEDAEGAEDADDGPPICPA